MARSPMLSQTEAASLLDILGAEDESLETAVAAFHRSFARADHFRVAAAMCVLLQDQMLPPRGALAALYIVHHLHKEEAAGAHPFMPFLVARCGALDAGGSESEAHQRNLLCVLLAPPPAPPPAGGKDVHQKSPAELCAGWRAGGKAPTLPNLAALRASYAERDAAVPEMQRVGIRCVHTSRWLLLRWHLKTPQCPPVVSVLTTLPSPMHAPRLCTPLGAVASSPRCSAWGPGTPTPCSRPTTHPSSLCTSLYPRISTRLSHTLFLCTPLHAHRSRRLLL